MTHPLSSADISIFHRKSRNFTISRNTDIDCISDTEFLIPLTFFESLKIVSIKMVKILMMSAKMATLDLLKIKIFQNKGYDVINSVYDVTSKNLSRDSNYILDVIM